MNWCWLFHCIIRMIRVFHIKVRWDTLKNFFECFVLNITSISYSCRIFWFAGTYFFIFHSNISLDLWEKIVFSSVFSCLYSFSFHYFTNSIQYVKKTLILFQRRRFPPRSSQNGIRKSIRHSTTLSDQQTSITITPRRHIYPALPWTKTLSRIHTPSIHDHPTKSPSTNGQIPAADPKRCQKLCWPAVRKSQTGVPWVFDATTVFLSSAPVSATQCLPMRLTSSQVEVVPKRMGLWYGIPLNCGRARWIGDLHRPRHPSRRFYPPGLMRKMTWRRLRWSRRKSQLKRRCWWVWDWGMGGKK